jgi:hypothetical protein
VRFDRLLIFEWSAVEKPLLRHRPQQDQTPGSAHAAREAKSSSTAGNTELGRDRPNLTVKAVVRETLASWSALCRDVAN